MDTASGICACRTLYVGIGVVAALEADTKLTQKCLQSEHLCQILVTLKVDNSAITQRFPSQNYSQLNNGT